MDRVNLLIPKEVAKILRINPLTVYGLIRRGDLVAIKLGREYRINEIDLQRFLKNHLAKRLK